MVCLFLAAVAIVPFLGSYDEKYDCGINIAYKY